VGRDCAALLRPVLDKGRALPWAWRVRQGPKGHGSADLPIAMVALLREVSPAGAIVVVLGDGECDGTALPAPLNAAGGSDVCRTAQSTVATWEGAPFRRETLGAWSQPGPRIALPEVQFPRDAYGPVRVLSCGAQGYHEPRYLVSHRAAAEEACR
jgi:hypothetical protein